MRPVRDPDPVLLGPRVPHPAGPVHDLHHGPGDVRPVRDPQALLLGPGGEGLLPDPHDLPDGPGAALPVRDPQAVLHGVRGEGLPDPVHDLPDREGVPLPLRDPQALLHGLREVRQERPVHDLPDGPRAALPVRVPQALLHGQGDVLQDGPVHRLPHDPGAARPVRDASTTATRCRRSTSARSRTRPAGWSRRRATRRCESAGRNFVPEERVCTVPYTTCKMVPGAAHPVRAQDDLRDAAVLPHVHVLPDGARSASRCATRLPTGGCATGGCPTCPSACDWKSSFYQQLCGFGGCCK